MWLLGIAVTAMRRSSNETSETVRAVALCRQIGWQSNLIRPPIHPSRLLMVMTVAFGAKFEAVRTNLDGGL
jgi:hypothetical protein